MSLVYALIAKSNPDEMRYVGKTASATPKRRRNSHIYEAKRSAELTYKLNWIRKVLSKSDEVLVITLESNLTEEQSFERETFFIDHYRSLGHRLTNATDGGDGPTGYVHTEETKAKISLAHIGKTKSEETKHNMSLAQRGRFVSEEAKHNMSLAQGGRVCSDETRCKQSLAHIGKVHTEETKRKQSLANIGHVVSEETKRKQSLANMGTTNAKRKVTTAI